MGISHKDIWIVILKCNIMYKVSVWIEPQKHQHGLVKEESKHSPKRIPHHVCPNQHLSLLKKAWKSKPRNVVAWGKYEIFMLKKLFVMEKRQHYTLLFSDKKNWLLKLLPTYNNFLGWTLNDHCYRGFKSHKTIHFSCLPSTSLCFWIRKAVIFPV